MLKNLLTIFCISILLTGCGGEADDSVSASDTTSSNQNTTSQAASIKLEKADLEDLFKSGMFKHEWINSDGEKSYTYRIFSYDGSLKTRRSPEHEKKYNQKVKTGRWWVVEDKVCMRPSATHEKDFCYEIHLSEFNKYITKPIESTLTLIEDSYPNAITGDDLEMLADGYNKMTENEGLLFFVKGNYLCGKFRENSIMTSCKKLIATPDNIEPYSHSFFPSE